MIKLSSIKLHFMIYYKIPILPHISELCYDINSVSRLFVVIRCVYTSSGNYSINQS